MNLLWRIVRQSRISEKEIVGWTLVTLVLVGLDQLGLYFLDAGDTPNSPPIPESISVTILGFGAELFITMPLLFVKTLAMQVFGIGGDFFMSDSNNAMFDIGLSALVLGAYGLCKVARTAMHPSAC